MKRTHTFGKTLPSNREKSKKWETLRATCLVLFLSVSFAAYSQITVNLKDISLRASLKKIEQVSSYKFFYNENLTELNQKVSLNVQNATIEQTMEKLLHGMELSYRKEKENVIVLVRKVRESKQAVKTVTGKVIDVNGEPIIGASVQVKGESKGTITDFDGKFILSDVPENSILTFSYIGYATIDVAATDKKLSKITMVEDSKLIDEVVVVGYGVQKKSDITGSVTSVKSAELLSAPNANTAQALQGRVAGVVVQDAAALSVYGSKGANGVILVTTKNGKNGKPQVTYNGFLSFDEVRRKLPALNARDYALLVNEAREENGLEPVFGPDEIPLEHQTTNWQDKIFRKALSQSHNVSLSGAKENMSYFIAGGYVNKDGIVQNTNFKQYTLRANFKVQATSRLNFSLNTFFSYDETHNGDYGQAIASALQWSPTKRIYDSESKGGYMQPGGGVGPVSIYNPVGYALETVDENSVASSKISLMAEYKFWDFLKLSSLFAYKTNSDMYGWFDNPLRRSQPVGRRQQIR